MKPTDKLKLEAQKENFAEKEVNKISSNSVLSDDLSAHQIRDIIDWIGFRYYRVNNWQWREIRDESNLTRYTSKDLAQYYLNDKSR